MQSASDETRIQLLTVRGGGIHTRSAMITVHPSVVKLCKQRGGAQYGQQTNTRKIIVLLFMTWRGKSCHAIQGILDNIIMVFSLAPRCQRRVNNMPVLQAVENNPSVERVLVFAIHCFKMPIPSEIDLLIDSQVGKHQFKLKEKTLSFEYAHSR